MISLDLKWLNFPPKKSAWNKKLTEVFRAVGRYWHEHFLPKHFTEAGAREYGYFARKGERLPPGSKAYRRSYTGRKERRFGHTLPLVHSGLSRSLARLLKLRVSSKGGRVLLPTGFNRKHPKSRIVMRDEITRISTGERDVLLHVAQTEMDRQLQAT